MRRRVLVAEPRPQKGSSPGSSAPDRTTQRHFLGSRRRNSDSETGSSAGNARYRSSQSPLRLEKASEGRYLEPAQIPGIPVQPGAESVPLNYPLTPRTDVNYP